jgi:hypothetical protein
MANLTQERVKQIIEQAPEGTTPGGIIAALREQGHTLEGYPSDEKTTTTRTAGNFLSSVLGVASRALQVPSTLVSLGARAVGEAIGFESSKTGREQNLAQQAEAQTFEEIKRIPGEVLEGAKEGFFGESDLTSPSKELGVTGLGGFAVDVVGDPINLLGAGLVKKLGQNIPKSVPVVQKFGEKLLQSLLNQAPKQTAKEFKSLGRVFDGAVKEIPDTLGRRFGELGIKFSGSATNLLKKINREITKVGKQLDKKIVGVTQKIDLGPIIGKIEDMAQNFRKAGKDAVADRLDSSALNLLSQTGNQLRIPASDAITLKRIFDDLRITGSGVLSEARGAEQRIFRTISNGLRNQINKIPEIGSLNRKLSTLFDGLESLSKVAAKEASKGALPIKFSEFFPFLRLNLGSFSRTKSSVGQALTSLGKTLQIPQQILKDTLKSLAPSALRNLFNR